MARKGTGYIAVTACASSFAEAEMCLQPNHTDLEEKCQLECQLQEEKPCAKSWSVHCCKSGSPTRKN
eukprot:876200-Pelagomonas_calceolata.AAC.1